VSDEELDALAALSSSFNWTLSREDVWTRSPYHVEDLHPGPTGMIRRGVDRARASKGSNPLGVVLVGQQGAGKTHLLGWAREHVQQTGGYFFLVGDLSGKTFWDETRSSILEQLLRENDGQSQLTRLLKDLARRAGLPRTAWDAVTGGVPPTKDDLSQFAAALYAANKSVPPPGQDVAKALILLASPRQDHHEIGYSFLADDDLDREERRAWGLRSTRLDVKFLIVELFRILAISGPMVVAVDQIDALIDKVTRNSEPGGTTDDEPIAQVARDLMELHGRTRRTLTVIACLGESWDHVMDSGLATVRDRFLDPTQLANIPTPEAGRLLIAKRFTVALAEIGRTAAYPTWPIQPVAFLDAPAYTARTLLQRAERHISACMRNNAVRELDRLDDEPSTDDRQRPVASSPAGPRPIVDQQTLDRLDGVFRELRARAEVDVAFDEAKEDAEMSSLLAAGLDAWKRECGADGRIFHKDPRRADAALHACLRRVSEDRLERQRRWAFRAIAAVNAKAVQSRIKKAIAAAGLNGEGPERQLFLLRNTPWPTGPRTQELRAEFRELGGAELTVTTDDLKTFAALRHMIDGHLQDLDGWLAARQPAHSTDLFARALADAGTNELGGQLAVPADDPAAGQAPRADRTSVKAGGSSAIRIGTSYPDQAPVHVDLHALRRHVAIFAGSGSGKTVLLRRIVEECALRGVSSIVLDPNNDLARLGDAWPDDAEHWLAGDAERAREYLACTDVTVWTPRRQGGRPLTFQPLPAFADLLDDADEFDAAVDVAVEALAPRLKANKPTSKAEHEKAVLRQALEFFGRRRGGDLDDFVALLSDLPAEASHLGRADVVARDLADRLRVARVNDPLFGGSGLAADPGMLLTPPDGKRARVSVISLVGLPGLEQRQGFVNQLQMALFSWIKRNPAQERPLGGLFVMDEAQDLAPSTGTTACTVSTLRLVAQARKYGLGLLFATQAPRGLHNWIPANSTTQLFGLLNSLTQISAARDLAKAKGGDIPNIGSLSAGQFYLATEGSSFLQIRTPMCLSHHAGPLTEEEVIARARRT
jgi:Helicase HerA, central domain